jgi:hypothetical protein
MFDVIKRDSLEAVTHFWLDFVHFKIFQDMSVVIIRNKADPDGVAFRSQSKAIGEENNCSVHFMSARTGGAIADCVKEVAEKVVAWRRTQVNWSAITTVEVTPAMAPWTGCCEGWTTAFAMSQI